MRVLVVEDDRKIASFVVQGLQEAGFAVDQTTNGAEGLHLALTNPYDTAVIDIMLPGLDGLSLVEALRRHKVQTPVIILSAKHSVDDRVKGLQTGSDDYLTKPFAFAELLARVQALIRRGTGTAEPTRLIAGELGRRERKAGLGDLTMRVKLNFWGNDGGPTAFAIIPFVKIPTNQNGLGNNATEGGVIFPLAVELPLGWRMGVQTELDINRDANGSGYHPEFINSVTVGHDIIGNLGGYIEFFSLVSTDTGSPWIGTVDMGFMYKVADNIQIDAGVNIGVTTAAEDVNPFVGLSLRF